MRNAAEGAATALGAAATGVDGVEPLLARYEKTAEARGAGLWVGLFALVWGTGVFCPAWSLFASALSFYGRFAQFAPEWAWGAAFAVCGTGQMIALMRRWYQAAWAMGVILLGLLAFAVTAFFMAGWPQGVYGGALYGVHFLAQMFVVVRVGDAAPRLIRRAAPRACGGIGGARRCLKP